MNICVYGAASNMIDNEYIKAGEALGRVLSLRSHTLVFGGGANGLMGALARGVKENNGYVLGVAPSFFNVDGVLFEQCDEFITTDTMRERKQVMDDRSDAFIVTPGGIGTFEEFFEMLTLKSLAQSKKPIAIFNTNGYYDDLLAFLRNGVRQNFLKDDNLSLFFVSDDPEKIIDYCENSADNVDDVSKTRYL